MFVCHDRLYIVRYSHVVPEITSSQAFITCLVPQPCRYYSFLSIGYQFKICSRAFENMAPSLVASEPYAVGSDLPHKSKQTAVNVTETRLTDNAVHSVGNGTTHPVDVQLFTDPCVRPPRFRQSVNKRTSCREAAGTARCLE